MRAGRLCHRVEVQRATLSTVDGEVVKAWATVETVWAEVSPLLGAERYAVRQTASEVTHRVTMAYVPGLNLSPRDRLKFGERVFDIESALNVRERGTELVVMAVERV